MTKRRKYSAEFKREAVQLANHPGVTKSQIARELGVNSNMLGRWCRQLKTEGSKVFVGKGYARDDEMARLKRGLVSGRAWLSSSLLFFDLLGTTNTRPILRSPLAAGFPCNLFPSTSSVGFDRFNRAFNGVVGTKQQTVYGGHYDVSSRPTAAIPDRCGTNRSIRFDNSAEGSITLRPICFASSAAIKNPCSG